MNAMVLTISPKRWAIRTFGVLALTVATLFLVTPSASAATCTFTGAVDNDWHTDGNWDCAAVPGTSDSAILPPGVSVSATTAVVNVGDLQVASGAILEAIGQNITVSGTATSSQNGGTILGTGAVTFQDVVSTGTIRITDAAGSLNFEGNATNTGSFLTDAADVTVRFLGTWDNASGIFDTDFRLRFEGALNQLVPSNVTSVRGFTMQKTASSTLTLQTNLETTAGNSGVVLIGAGPATFNLGGFTITIKGNSLSMFGSNGITNGALALDPLFGTMTATFSGQGDIDIDLTVSSGAITFVGSPAGATFDMTGDLTVTTGTLAFTDAHLSVGGTTVNGGTINNSGALSFGGVVDNSGGGVIGNGGSSKITFMALLDNSGSSVVNAGTGGLEFYGAVDTSGGGSITNASTTHFLGTSSAAFTGGLNVAGSIVLAKDAGTTLTIGSGSVTTTGALSIAAGNTLALGTNNLSVDGTITNSGLITRSGNSILHPAESHAFTDGSGSTITTINSDGLLYVTLQDSNLNLDGTLVETVDVVISSPDTETITLTETGPATGIFRNTTGLSVVHVLGSSTPENGRFELTADATLTSTYTDPYDGTEINLATVAASTAPASTPAPASSGGGGLPAAPVEAPVTVYGSSTVDEAALPAHSLLKLPCPVGADVNHPCKAVYYLGTQGKRHAFPNDKVFFTWYETFDGVQLISESQMSQIPLGANVTYKPGVKMVKFTTDPKVYAVAKGGVLRWVKTQELAAALYGIDWNRKIDDISDAFYANYRFGTDIDTTADYDPADEAASVRYPSDSLEM